MYEGWRPASLAFAETALWPQTGWKAVEVKVRQCNEKAWVCQQCGRQMPLHQMSGRVEVLVLVYVDDMAIVALKVQGVMWFKSELGKVFLVTDLGELRHILG